MKNPVTCHQLLIAWFVAATSAALQAPLSVPAEVAATSRHG